MGLRGGNGLPDPRFFPTGTPAELKAQGYDLREVRSCCVELPGQIKGCMHALECHQVFGQPGTRRAERVGDFGPPSTTPGTPGRTVENVPYSLRDADGTGKEDYTICYIFLANLYKRMLSSANPDPDQRSADKIRILGKAGEVKIAEDTAVPEQPRGGPTGKNMRMLYDTQVRLVPHYRDEFPLDRAAAARHAADAAEDEELFEALVEAPVTPLTDEIISEAIGDDEPVVASEPIKRRESRGKAN